MSLKYKSMSLKYEPSSEQRVQEADIAARSSAKRVGEETRVLVLLLLLYSQA